MPAYSQQRVPACVNCDTCGRVLLPQVHTCKQAVHRAAHLAMAGYIRARDPSRPVHYEGGGARTPATDILCPMYARIGQVRGPEDLP